MERKEFLKKLGVGTMIFPLFSRCLQPDNPNHDPTTEFNEGGTNTSCVRTVSETAGPFPTKNPGTLVRENIVGDRTGIALDMEMTILNINTNCAPLEGAIVDIWHCDKDGYYSEYGGTQMQQVDFSNNSFLRGRQTSDENGKVAFTSIFPSWYQGRATHIHVHVFNKSGNSLLVTQIAFPEGSNSAVVHVNAATQYGYTKGMNGYTYNSNDNVFSDGVATEMCSISGSVSGGFSLVHNIVVSA
ncbi:intradiol ring-cleavage dioxygenase [Arthrospiribacter ruber]|uniref:Intradiol ring-cleavage dioxygenase n=1 Tax=Arthrospiribacter ruber TaxID=2487934 RepID=A0A951J642_9BACT|nr:intradiol ring-cleavage dioxygenase [Arthrospiribacter ruber]MBW3470462.1 intradiol ring-cleavage dioxygenase [Arthrospiribacter ruber]